jgi:queuine/archaeosine tRNA-ribosyltransferase
MFLKEGIPTPTVFAEGEKTGVRISDCSRYELFCRSTSDFSESESFCISSSDFSESESLHRSTATTVVC